MIVGWAAAGCGGGGGSSLASGTTTPVTVTAAIAAKSATAAAPNTPQGAPAPAPTVAQATTTASTINLTTADLPAGWSGSPSDEGAPTTADSQLALCAGAPDPRMDEIADVYSYDFVNGPNDVTSDVTAIKTVAQAQQDLVAAGSDKEVSCGRQYAQSVFLAGIPPQTKASIVNIGRIPTTAFPAGTFTLRVVLRMTAAGQTIQLIVDEVGFRHGRYEVSAAFKGTDVPFPPALEQSVVAKLMARAAHAPST